MNIRSCYILLGHQKEPLLVLNWHSDRPLNKEESNAYVSKAQSSTNKCQGVPSTILQQKTHNVWWGISNKTKYLLKYVSPSSLHLLLFSHLGCKISFTSSSDTINSQVFYSGSKHPLAPYYHWKLPSWVLRLTSEVLLYTQSETSMSYSNVPLENHGHCNVVQSLSFWLQMLTSWVYTLSNLCC